MYPLEDTDDIENAVMGLTDAALDVMGEVCWDGGAHDFGRHQRVQPQREDDKQCPRSVNHSAA